MDVEEPPIAGCNAVVLHRECCSPCEIVVEDEILDGTDMAGQLFGKRQGVAHETGNARCMECRLFTVQ